jgi:dipeptidyl aminopeptidase/acylaminoacyl peptidase
MIGGAGTLVALVGAGVLLLGWRASEGAMHPGAASQPLSLADYPHLTPEAVKVRSRTGVELAGRFFRGRDDATVVLTHGYGGDQDEMLAVADALHEAGFNVFTYDLRGCGDSTGGVTFGALEQQDLRSVVDALARRPEVDSDAIGALGFSMGGATTVMAAAGDPRIKAVVADSAWSDVRHWLKPRWPDVLLRPTARFTPVSLRLIELRAGIDLHSLRPAALISRLSPRPVLLIHGTADRVVPADDARLNYDAAEGPRDLWYVQDAAHGDTLRPGGAASSPRVVAFFDEALRAAPS